MSVDVLMCVCVRCEKLSALKCVLGGVKECEVCGVNECRCVDV